MRGTGKARRAPEDWIEAAIDALAEGGVAAVAVEPIAARLGATKGSFYWHFANRDALLSATLHEWEQRSTEAAIRDLDGEADPAVRLRRLLTVALQPGRGRIDLALLAHADHPLVGPVLHRVTVRRTEYLTSLFTALGFSRTQAERRALLAYTAYLGLWQAGRAAPEVLPASPQARRRYIDQVHQMLVEDRY